MTDYQQEGNLKMARFMGADVQYPYGDNKDPMLYYPKDTSPTIWRNIPLCSIKYHSSYDWLMTVVDKVRSLERGRFDFTRDPWGVSLADYSTRSEVIFAEALRDDKQTDLELYFDVVLQFFEWQEKQNK